MTLCKPHDTITVGFEVACLQTFGMKVGLLFPELTIPAEEVDFFHQMVHSLLLKEGEYFVASNTRCDKIAFIDSGLLCVVKATRKRKFILLHHTENQFASVFTSFLTGENSPWAIQALEPTHLTVISNHLFHQLCERHICWIQFWLKVLGTQTTDLTKREKHLLHT
jgi:CRP-like cAMP-binding protein